MDLSIVSCLYFFGKVYYAAFSIVTPYSANNTNSIFKSSGDNVRRLFMVLES
jgi:hypothetical protein